MRAPRLTSFVAGAVCALVVGSGTAVAATGGKFILGHGNSASRTTSLSSANGPALALRTRSGTAPLSVSSRTRVPNLNADTVDGVSSEALALASGATGAVQRTATAEPDLQVDPDDPDFFEASVACPPHTVLTGGGVNDNTNTGATVWNAPDTEAANAWKGAVSIDTSAAPEDSAQDLPANVTVYAVCYNPRGALPASSRKSTTAPSGRPVAHRAGGTAARR